MQNSWRSSYQCVAHTHTHTHTLGGPALCGLNCRPYFTCRSAMNMHVQQLAAYCERTWATKVGLNRMHKPRPYTHRPRRTAQEVEEHRLQRALQGNLQLGLAPSSEQTTFAKGGGGCSSFAADFFPVIGDGKLPQRPYPGTRRRANTNRGPPPAPPADPSKCAQHSADACTTCKRFRRTAETCCALGHHADDHIARRPQLQLCSLHGLPPCPRCTLKQRGVRHCCQRGHHKVCTPVPARRKRPLAAHAQLPNKRPRLRGPARISTGLLRSPHQPPTPPAPKRRRPKTPPPPSPPAPVPRGLEETVAEDVARPLFVTRHRRANTLDT